VWVDADGGLHIDIVAVLAAAGYADTVENRATMLAAVRAQATKIGAAVTEVED
jgi:hypothetical protein